MRLLGGEKSPNKSVTLTPRLLVWHKIFSVKIVFTAWESKLLSPLLLLAQKSLRYMRLLSDEKSHHKRGVTPPPKIRSLICAYLWCLGNSPSKLEGVLRSSGGVCFLSNVKGPKAYRAYGNLMTLTTLMSLSNLPFSPISPILLIINHL